MPSLSRRRSFVALSTLSFIIAGCASAPRATEPASRAAERLDDSTFWRMMIEYSEPWGVFRSENLVSNETSLQWVIPELQCTVPTGRVYVGVAPDQNFTYIAALERRFFRDRRSPVWRSSPPRRNDSTRSPIPGRSRRISIVSVIGPEPVPMQSPRHAQP